MKITSVIAAVLAVITLFACLTGCAAKKESPAAEAPEKETPEKEAPAGDTPAVITGGWSLDIATECKLPDEVQTAFDKAMQGYAGAGFTPVAYLGSQVVAGSNYEILCKSTLVTNPPVTSLKVIIIYADLSGNATVSTVADFNIGDYTDNGNDIGTELIPGGWAVPDTAAVTLTGDAADAFEKALAGYTGVALEPLAVLGSQIVAGVNYAYLCRATVLGSTPATGLALVRVYRDLEGKAEITDVCAVKAADFNK